MRNLLLMGKISDGPSDLAAAEAAGAHVNVLRRTVDDGLDALHIGLPHAVAAPVGMADLDAESDTLVAEFTLCHTCCTSSFVVSFRAYRREKSLLIIADGSLECKNIFYYFSNCSILSFCCQMPRK